MLETLSRKDNVSPIGSPFWRQRRVRKQSEVPMYSWVLAAGRLKRKWIESTALVLLYKRPPGNRQAKRERQQDRQHPHAEGDTEVPVHLHGTRAYSAYMAVTSIGFGQQPGSLRGEEGPSRPSVLTNSEMERAGCSLARRFSCQNGIGAPPILGTLFRRHRVRGLSTSLSESPSRFHASTMVQAAAPGASSIHGTSRSALSEPASSSIVPRLGLGG